MTAVVAGAALADAAVGVVVVHGRGQDPAFIVEHLVDRLDVPEAAFAVPAAPGGSWYPERFIAPRAGNEPWLGQALAALDGELSRFDAAGLASNRVVLAGFSQGACLVAEYVARRPRRYGGVAVLTGGLIGAAGEVMGPATRLDGVPVAFVTSSLDEWVPVERVRESAAAFEHAGATVTLEIADDPEHRIDDRAVAAVQRLLLQVVNRGKRVSL